MFAHGRNLDVITQVQSIETFQPLRDNLERLSRALYAAELVDRATEERAENFAVYRLLLDALRRLSQRDDLDLVLRFFEMSLLVQLGYQPEISECVICRRPIPEQGISWSAGAGGVVCSDCRPPEVTLQALSAGALKVLRLLQGGSFSDVARFQFDARLSDELERHLRETIHHALERDVRSAGFIETVRRKLRTASPAAGPR
jgi:DNA repair protein RecO (recombination protein O)